MTSKRSLGTKDLCSTMETGTPWSPETQRHQKCSAPACAGHQTRWLRVAEASGVHPGFYAQCTSLPPLRRYTYTHVYSSTGFALQENMCTSKHGDKYTDAKTEHQSGDGNLRPASGIQAGASAANVSSHSLEPCTPLGVAFLGKVAC